MKLREKCAEHGPQIILIKLVVTSGERHCCWVFQICCFGSFAPPAGCNLVSLYSREGDRRTTATRTVRILNLRWNVTFFYVHIKKIKNQEGDSIIHISYSSHGDNSLVRIFLFQILYLDFVWLTFTERNQPHQKQERWIEKANKTEWLWLYCCVVRKQLIPDMIDATLISWLILISDASYWHCDDM